MDILFTNDDDKKKELYELGFKLNNKDAKCINLKEAGLKNKVKFEVTDADAASVYSKECDFLTISVKEELYIDGLSEEEQPGENYKTINNNERMMNNAEIASYYSDVVKKLGGNAKAKWIDKVTVAKDGKVLKSFSIENDALLTSKVSMTIDKTNPIHSITLVPEFGDIHYSDCNTEEVKFLHEIRNKEVVNKISKAISEIKGEL